MACGTTAIWWLTATLQILLHLLETALQLNSAATYVTASYDVTNDVINPHVIAYVIIGVIAFSSCVTNVVSAVWTYRGMDFSAQKAGGTICGVLHVLQLGPVWRYFKLLLVGDYRDVEELFKLRILQVCLQNAAYIVIQGGMLIANTSHKPAQLILGVAVSFISVIFTFTCCSHTASNTLTFVTNFESRSSSRCSYNRKVCSVLRLISRVLRHTFMLASRLLALILLAHACRAWVVLLVVGHLVLFYLVFLVWSIVTHDTHELPIASRLPDILLFGLVEVFDFTSRLYTSNRQVVIYYTVILAENTAMGLIWYFTRQGAAYNDMLLVLVFTFFILGVIACVFSEGFIHGSKSSTLDGDKEEKKNLDMIESFSVKDHIDNLAVDDTGAKPDLNQISPSDFDLDLKEILFASAYNPKVCKEVTVTSNRVLRQAQDFPTEAQTSSDSGFVSRLFDHSCLENDSEGYSTRETTTTPSMDSSALPPDNHTDTKDNTDSTDIYQCLYTSDMEHTQSVTSKDDSVGVNNPKAFIHKPRRPSRRRPGSLQHRPRPPKSWAGHRTHLDSDYDSDTSSQSSTSCGDCQAGQVAPQALPRHRRRRGRPLHQHRSRSVPDNRRQYNTTTTGLSYTGTSGSSTALDRAAHPPHSRTLPRSRPPVFHYGESSSTSSGSSSDSFFDSYQRRTRAPYSIGSSSWSDSQSLGDSDFGFTRTWPPGRRCSIVNIYELPIEQITVKEHVVSWLRGVEETLTGGSTTTWQPTPAVTDRGQREEAPQHRFDSFRDVKIAYIDSYRDISHMSDTGIMGGKQTDTLCYTARPRTVSEGGDKPRRSGLFRFCGVKVPRSGGRKKWLDRKIMQRFSFSGNRQKMIIVNKEATYNSNVEMLGLESSV